MKKTNNRDPASFRDPSGHIFFENDKAYRRINAIYLEKYQRIKNSGLFSKLISEKLLISHTDGESGFDEFGKYQIIIPDTIPFISYPYEWSFSQLRDAALLTLKILNISLDYGIILKDATPFNVQFVNGEPIFIDTLSFDIWDGKPWVAYRQFCEMFLTNLSIMSYCHPKLGIIQSNFLDGIPLEVASKILPIRSKLNIGLLIHIFLHSREIKSIKDNQKQIDRKMKISKNALKGLCANLKHTVKTLNVNSIKSQWDSYYTNNRYSSQDFKMKTKFISDILSSINPKRTWDLGCNAGEFSIIASKYSEFILSIDSDHSCIEQIYDKCRNNQIKNILPILMDLTNPTSQLGWNLSERKSFKNRGSADMVIALALIHHICISHNIPINFVSQFFYDITQHLIIEFIPKSDSQIQEMLLMREDIFIDYNVDIFESEFSKKFSIIRKENLIDSKRILYYMVKIKNAN
ncbi:hypothetical protein DSECCO2_85450 [anaerobic digester metagenome]